ncbi:MAG: BatD family protein [Verrucomicrobia bacterium]|nr:BatD family protein [Verrucomicrobiota bacterium]
MKARGDIRFRTWTAFLLASALTLCQATSQQVPQIHVSVNQAQVFVGDSVLLTVLISGARNIEDPTIPNVDGLDVSAPQRSSENSVSIVNFQKTESFRTSFIYQLTPRRTGAFSLGPITARVMGQSLAHPPVTFSALGGEVQNFVLMELKSTRDTVLVDEPFVVTFSLLIKRIPGPYKNHDPLHPENPPQVVLSYLDNCPEGLVGPDIKPLLQNALINNSQEPGFKLNNYTVRNDPFSMFSLGSLSQSREATFKLNRAEVRRDNIDYFEYTLALQYRADREGRYTFEGPLFKGHVILAVDQAGRISTRPIMATGQVLTVDVTPPPTEGRPDSFIGSIGTSLVARATLDTQTCNVGDPLILTIDIGGDISLKNMEPPKLGKQEAFVRRFRVVDDSVQTESRAQGKTYRYTIRSKEAGTYELAPIEISYYDTARREYRVVHTAPIPFRAQKVADVADDWILNQSTNRTSQALISNSDWHLVAPMTASPEGAVPDSIINIRQHAVMASAGFLVFILAHIASLIRKALRHIRFGGRHRTAGRYACRALKQLSTDENTAEMLVSIRHILGTFLKEKYRLSSPPQTPADIERLLSAQASVSREAAEAFIQHYQKIFNTQFSSQNDDLDVTNLRDTALDIMARMEPRRPRSAKSAQAIMLVLAAAASLSARADDVSLEQRFIWDEASSALSHARTPAEFATAAALHRKMLQAGVVNGPALYNMGTALLKAEQYKDAIDAFHRAERYMGSSLNIRRNMAIAAAQGSQGGAEKLSWMRVPLFWHYELSGQLRISIAACAFSVFWLALLLHRGGAPSTGRPFLILSLLVFSVFGTSGLATWHAEQTSRQADRTRAETLAAPPPSPRENPSTPGATHAGGIEL